MRSIDTVIFDFDGTVVQSMKAVWKILNDLSIKYNFQIVKESEIEKYRAMSAWEVMKEMKIPVIKIPLIVSEVRKQLAEQIENLELVPGIKDVIRDLKTKDLRLGILTTNSQENVEKYLNRNDLDCFDFMYAGSSIFGKAVILKKLLKQRGLSVDRAIYIGDETRDIEASKEVGVKAVAVSWGYNSSKSLSKANPDWLINSPSELLDIIR